MPRRIKLPLHQPHFQLATLNKVTWLYLFLMLLWLFIALIIPATAVVGDGTNGATVNAFYDSYSSFSGWHGNGNLVAPAVWTALNGVGIATIVFYLSALVLALVTIPVYIYQQRRLGERHKPSWRQIVWYIDFLLLGVLSFAFFVLAMIPPHVAFLAKHWLMFSQIQEMNTEWSTAVAGLIPATGTVVNIPTTGNLPTADTGLETLIWSLTKELGITQATAPTTIAGWANLVQMINATPVPPPSGALTPLWATNGATVSATAGWSGVCGIFGTVFSIVLLMPVTSKVVVYLQCQELKNYRKLAKEMLANARQTMADKRAIRQKKKTLLEREDQLWASLEANDATSQNESALEKLSQFELEEKIAKTNELREEIEQLKQQRAELQSQRAKKKPASYRQATRNKKQKIAVPDDELEDIFKSLDL